MWKQNCKTERGAEVLHGNSIIGWTTSSLTCPSTCSSQTMTCDDGNLPGKATYKYSSCSLSSKTCPSGYGSKTDSHATYDDCTPSTAYGNTYCSNGTTVYKKTGCQTDYHEESGYSTCQYNYKTVSCTKSGAPENATYNVTNETITWNGSSRPNPSKCGWTCNSRYHKDGNSCVANTCGTKPANSRWWDRSNTQPYTNGDVGYSSSNTFSDCKWHCDAGYTLIGNECKKDCPTQGACSSAHHNDTCTTYDSPVQCPTKTCNTVTATCTNGSWIGTIGSSSCTVNAKNGCDSSFNITTGQPNNNSSTWESCTDYSAGTCSTTTKYKCKTNYEGSDCHEKVTNCTITFDPNGGRIDSYDGVKSNMNAVSRCNDNVYNGYYFGTYRNVKRDGYTFDGWYTDPVRGSEINLSNLTYTNTTYYAHWTKKSSSDPCANLSNGSQCYLEYETTQSSYDPNCSKPTCVLITANTQGWPQNKISNKQSMTEIHCNKLGGTLFIIDNNGGYAKYNCVKRNSSTTTFDSTLWFEDGHLGNG